MKRLLALLLIVLAGVLPVSAEQPHLLLAQTWSSAPDRNADRDWQRREHARQNDAAYKADLFGNLNTQSSCLDTQAGAQSMATDTSCETQNAQQQNTPQQNSQQPNRHRRSRHYR